jgi:hypothetical protein
MAIVGKRTRPTPLQGFRAFGEGLLLQAAQRRMLRQYPGVPARPPLGGPVSRFLGAVLGLGFHLAPWPVRRRVMHAMFTRRPPAWPGG